MSYSDYKSLQLNNQQFSNKSLLSFVNQKLEEQPKPWEVSFYQFVQFWLNDNPQINVQTSGSTGTPKIIALEKDNMVQSALATGKYFKLKKNDKALLCLPVDYIAGKMMLVRAFVHDLNLISVEPSSRPLKDINESIDFAAMTPMQVRASLENDQDKFKLVDTLIIGGGVVDQKLIVQLQNISTKCYATYGMTETITHIAIKKLNGKEASDHYHALDQVSFSQDDRSCLCISAKHLNIDSIITNDHVKLIDDKTFQWLGRYDNVINSGGLKIQPELVEKLLKEHIKERFFIAGVKDETLGEKVALFIEGKSWKPDKITKLYSDMATTIQRHENPKAFFFINEFSETATGKIQRKQTISRLILLNK